MNRQLGGLLAAAMVVTLGAAAVVAQVQDPQAADDAVRQRLVARSRDFLQDVAVGKTADAFATLLAGGPLAARTEALATLVERAAELETRYGKSREVESLSFRQLGSDVAVLTMLSKCERAPVAWHLVFYRPSRGAAGLADDSSWVVISVRFDADMEKLAASIPAAES